MIFKVTFHSDFNMKLIMNIAISLNVTNLLSLETGLLNGKTVKAL